MRKGGRGREEGRKKGGRGSEGGREEEKERKKKVENVCVGEHEEFAIAIIKE